jgi:hypothetical protein
VVQRQHARPFRPLGEYGLEPDLRLRTGVGEDQRAPRILDGPKHHVEQSDAEVAGPGKPLDGDGHERIDHDLLGHEAAHQTPSARGSTGMGAKQRLAGGVEIAECCRKPPGAELRTEPAEPRERELGLHAALGRHQLVPLVHHHELEVREERRCIGAGEEQ